MVGRHDDAIVSLGFQGAISARRQAAVAAAGDPTAITAAAAAAAFEPQTDTQSQGSRSNSTIARNGCQLGEEQSISRDSATPNVGGERLQQGGSGAETGDDEEEGGREEGFGLVVLSSCVDGTVRAWETLGMSEKYRMRHPRGEEVSSMLVLPGGCVMATGKLPKFFHCTVKRCDAYDRDFRQVIARVLRGGV